MCAGTTRTPASAKGSKVGDLMVEGTYIFDCEVFAYDWLLYSIVFCFQTPGRAGTLAA